MVLPIYLIYLLLLKTGFSRNIPPHESFRIKYGPSLEYMWRNTSKAHVGIFNRQFYCCSSLVTLEHALTTAGCFIPMGTDVTKMLAYGGTIFHYHHDPRAQVRAVKEVVIHEKYSINGKPDNDIALAVVTPPFVQTFRLSTVRLPNRFIINTNTCKALFTIETATTYFGLYATIAMNGLRFRNATSFYCNYCNDEFKVTNAYTDENGTIVDKLICFRGMSNRWVEGGGNLSEMFSCYGGVGCPLMTYDNELVAMISFTYVHNCSIYPGTNIFVRTENCSGENEERYIQVFPYVNWIKSKINKKKLTRFRPYRIATKKIIIKPYVPLLVYLILLAIVIMVFLVCNRAVFGRIRL